MKQATDNHWEQMGWINYKISEVMGSLWNVCKVDPPNHGKTSRAKKSTSWFKLIQDYSEY